MPVLTSAIPLVIFCLTPANVSYLMPEGKGGTQDHFFLLGLTFIKWMLLCNATKTKSKWGCNGSYYLCCFTDIPGFWLVNAHGPELWLADIERVVRSLAIILFNTILHSPNPKTQNSVLIDDEPFLNLDNHVAANHSGELVIVDQ